MRVILLFLAMLFAAAAKPPPLGVEEGPVAPSGRSFGGGRVVASGSGFVVARGRVLTNAHVVRGCGAVLARNAAGRRARAGLVRLDTARDLAVLRVPDAFGPALVFRDTPEVARGEAVVTYGFPLSGILSSGPTLTTGTISALTGLRDSPLHITISAPVQPGNSGGPVLDAWGHVVGVVVSKLNAALVARLTEGDIPQNVNFAIRGEVALDFLREAGVAVATAASDGAAQSPAQVGAVANPSSAFLQCLR